MLIGVACGDAESEIEQDLATVSHAPQEPITLEAAGVSLTIDPDYGARVTSFQYQGREMLQTTPDAEGNNTGGTVWPSPQSDWDWPPPPQIDTGRYSVRKLRDNVYLFESQVDTSVDLSLEKRVQMAANGEVAFRYRLKNESAYPKIVAVWEVTRVPYDGYIRFPLSDTVYVNEGRLPLEAKEDFGYIYFDGQNTEAQKVFATLRDTAVQYVHDGLVFTKNTVITARNQTAPGQMPLEVFMEPRRGFAEFELQGGRYRLESGQSATFRTKWRLEAE